MSRRLRYAVCALLPLLAAGFAAAASVCQPDPSPNRAPDAPFRTDLPDALRPEERAVLLSIEDERYEERDTLLIDRRAASAERRLLTNTQAARILCPLNGDRAAAAAARLALPQALPTAPAVGTVNFDGGALRRSDAAGPPPAAQAKRSLLAAEAEADPALLRKVLSRVRLGSDPDPRASAALESAMRDVLRTPSGREVAEDFVALNASCDVSFGRLDGALVTINGRKVLSGSLGVTQQTDGRDVVVLNRLFLEADKELSSRELAGTLAHELFGHSLEGQRAERARFPASVLDHYRGDEANGRLIGWLVMTELGAPLSDGGMWNYLDDPESFHRKLALIDPYYAGTFSSSEMTDPLPVLRARLEETRRRRKRMDDQALESRKWRIVIKHFIQIHGMEARHFATLSEDIENFLDRERADLTRSSDEVEKELQEDIDLLETSGGREHLRRLSQSSRSDYLRAFEARLSRHLARLGMETRGRKPEPLVPPLPGQIEIEDLERLYQDDVRANPRHWGL